MATDTPTGLLIRVWFEPDDPGRVRARMLTVTDDHEPQNWTTRAGEPAVLEAVRAWLAEQRT